MKEIEIVAGKHCKKPLDMRITSVDNNKKDSIFAWIIYGICKKCKTIFMCSLFIQEEEPVLGRDFMIDYNKNVKGEKGYEPKRCLCIR